MDIHVYRVTYSISSQQSASFASYRERLASISSSHRTETKGVSGWDLTLAAAPKEGLVLVYSSRFSSGERRERGPWAGCRVECKILNVFSHPCKTLHDLRTVVDRRIASRALLCRARRCAAYVTATNRGTRKWRRTYMLTEADVMS
jgi:hypothetical protein